MTRFQKLSIATTASAVALVAIGAIVRATGSGLGCPGWPRCGGSWIPPLERAALIEYSHRMAAAVVGLLVLALAVFAWTEYRRFASVFWPSFAALLVVVFQGGLGRFVVERELEPVLVLVHFSTAMTLLCLLAIVTVNAFRPRGGRFSRFAWEAILLVAVTAVVLFLGTLVTSSGAALVFPDWPLMDGALTRSAGGLGLLHYLHRLGALLAGSVFVYVSVRAMRLAPRDRVLVSLAHSALALWVLQVVAGAANVLTATAQWAVISHVALGSAVWLCVVFLAAAAVRRATVKAVSETESRRSTATIKAYFQLTKPRIIELLLIATVPAMFVAAGGVPPMGLMLATLLGGSMTAGAANAINCYFDRDIDEKMERTASRPLPRHEIEPPKALIFGVVLGAAGVLWLAAVVNMPAALLSLSAILFYVFVYTLWLKRTTPSNIVIGGAAGAVPVLVGWAAVTGGVAVEAVVMFAIIFYWTPPHFWALSLRYSSEYASAGVPMLPVVRGPQETSRQIFLYSVAMVATSLLLFPVARMGLLYLVVALSLGAVFIYAASNLARSTNERNAMSLFRLSISYLTILFAAMAADVLIAGPSIAGAYPIAFVVSGVVFGAAKIAIIFEVGKSSPRGEPGSRAAELVWTIIPAVAVASLFLASYRAL